MTVQITRRVKLYFCCQKFCQDGLVEYKLALDDADREDIVVTNVLPQIGLTAVRRFRRVCSLHSDSLRRHSVL